MIAKEKKSWVVITVQKSVLKRIHKLKKHPRQSNSEVISILLDSYDKKQVKLDALAQ